MIIINADYINDEGKLVKCANIHIESGIIKDISFFDHAGNDDIIDATGKIVTPGFVDIHTSVGVINQINRFEGNDGNEAAGPILPHMRGIDALDLNDEGFIMARKGGVTTVLTGPAKNNLIGGTFCAIKTGGKSFSDRIIKDEIAFHFVLTSDPRGVYGKTGASPQTRMGSAALIREALYKAKEYYDKCKSGKKQDYNMLNHSLMRVFDGMLVKFSAASENDIYSAIRIADEFGLNYSLDICYDIVDMADVIKKDNINCVLGPLYGSYDSFENKNKKMETGIYLEKNGFEFAMTTGHPSFNLEFLPAYMALLVKAGMSKETVFKAFTINAAKIAGLDNTIGSISCGKSADILIWDNDPFDYYSNIEAMFINGVEIKSLSLN